MQQQYRLRKSREFSHVMQERNNWVNSLLVLKISSNNLPETRFGFITSKRLGNAVVRNRVKRRLREAARLVCLEGGWDCVFIARNRAASTSYRELYEAMESLLRRARLLKKTDPRPSRFARC